MVNNESEAQVAIYAVVACMNKYIEEMRDHNPDGVWRMQYELYKLLKVRMEDKP